MIDYPKGSYLKGDARSINRLYKQPFDAIIISMLFPSMDNLKDIRKVLDESRKCMKKDGTLLVAVTHPSFDHYMQSFLFQRKDVRADFRGYFSSGSKFEMDQQINGVPFRFEDYHWILSDYIETIQKAGLHLIVIDECLTTAQTPEDKEWVEKRNNIPSYLVFVLKK